MTHFSFISTYIEPFMGIILLAVLLYGLVVLVELIFYLSLEILQFIIRRAKRHARRKKKRRLHRRK